MHRAATLLGVTTLIFVAATLSIVDASDVPAASTAATIEEKHQKKKKGIKNKIKGIFGRIARKGNGDGVKVAEIGDILTEDDGYWERFLQNFASVPTPRPPRPQPTPRPPRPEPTRRPRPEPTPRPPRPTRPEPTRRPRPAPTNRPPPAPTNPPPTRRPPPAPTNPPPPVPTAPRPTAPRPTAPRPTAPRPTNPPPTRPPPTNPPPTRPPPTNPPPTAPRPTNPPPTSGGTRPLPPTQPGCVDCTNFRSPTMISRNSVCDSCNRCRPIECTQLNGFCEFTCFLSGYDIGKECCDYTQQLPDDGKDCQECTNIRTQRMVESGQQCATYQFGLLNRCARERPANPATGTPASRSWWLDSPVQYCQYSCWRANAGYQGKTLTGEMIVGEKKNQYPQTFDPRPCCPRSDATDPDIFPPPSPTLPLRSDGGSQDM